MIAFHTADWIKVAVTSYLEHFPNDRILVVDNNPKRGEVDWTPDCERERRWLLGHSRVDYLPNTQLPSDRNYDPPHGIGLDVALEWAKARGAEVLLHFEPDCLVLGRCWRENLLEAIAQGAWMAASFRHPFGTLHPTPSAWRIDRVRTSFSGQRRAGDACHPRYHELVDLERLRAEVEPRGEWSWWETYWDTGEKAWFECAVADRAAQVETPDFRHYWGGSTARHFGQSALVARHPELERWFNTADGVAARRRVGDCSYRTEIRGEGPGEVASCQLIEQLSGTAVDELCKVSRAACEACVASSPPSLRELNPVVASHLYSLAEQVINRGGVAGCSAEYAATLSSLAERNLEFHWGTAERPPEARVDVACIHLGGPAGFRPVATAAGHDRAIVYHCRHPDHQETTPEQCLACRDWTESAGLPRTPLSVVVPRPALRHGPRVQTWSVGVITAPRRPPTLDACLDSLVRAGWHEPRLFIDGSTTIATRHAHLPLTLREPRIGAWPNFYLALAELLMRDPEADAYMLVEDDAVFFDREDLRAYLEELLWPAEAVGAVSLYCSSVYTQAEPGWKVFSGPWVWGALAFVFPREAVRQLVGDPLIIAHRGGRDCGLADTDALIGRWSAARGLPIYFPTPSLVQHIGDRSASWPAVRALGFRRADQFAGDQR
jgi:hypothetical protein